MPASFSETALTLWDRFATPVLAVLAVAMVAGALYRAPGEWYRGVHEPAFNGALDLRMMKDTIDRWWAGGPVYGDKIDDNHPPATQVLLWPLAAPVDLQTARWTWAIGGVVGAAAISVLALSALGFTQRAAVASAALVVPAMFATWATIGNGQLAIFVVLALAFSIPALARSRTESLPPLVEAAAVVAMLFALSKPTLSAPFFWLCIFEPRTLRPAILTVGAYVATTAASALPRSESAFELVLGWLARGTQSAMRGSAHGAYGNVLSWSHSLGVPNAGAAIGLVILGLTGVWAWRRRGRDIWIGLAVCALAARMWTYHRLYDDLLLVFPMIALARIASTSERHGADSSTRATAGALLFATWLGAMAPARILAWDSPAAYAMAVALSCVWLADLVFLVVADGRPVASRPR